MAGELSDLAWRALTLAAKRGYVGASREDLFNEVRGVNYTELEAAIHDLESRGFITVEWTGPAKFVAMVTEQGSQFAREEWSRRIAQAQENVAGGSKAD